MRNTFRKNDGFTLMELMLTIAVGSIVTLAAVTVLLMGLRINKQAMDTASRQSTTRILLSSLEDMATEGTITKVSSGIDSWQICGGEDGATVLFSYHSADQAIYSGEKNNVLMEGVINSYITLKDQLLTIAVETEDGNYSSSVYCRMVVEDDTDTEADDQAGSLWKPDNKGTPQQSGASGLEFLKILASQYAIKTDKAALHNQGMILDSKGTRTVFKNPDGTSTFRYYSWWYITKDGADTSGWGQKGWGPTTPWCACFISWGLYETMYETGVDITRIPRYANVDNFKTYLESNNKWGDKWVLPKDLNGTVYKPQPGDLIFFDWKPNSNPDPEHIGAVIKAEDGYVYTIEGNSSNRVAVKRYPIDSPYIIGYGVIAWDKTQ